MSLTASFYLLCAILFAVFINEDSDAMQEGFAKEYEMCALFIGVNWWMYAVGALVLYIVVIGMKCCKDGCTAKAAHNIASFIAFYQFGWAIYGIVACWADSELVDEVQYISERIEAYTAKHGEDSVTCEKGSYEACYPKFWVMSIVMIWTRLAACACCLYCCCCCAFSISCAMCCGVGTAKKAAQEADAEGQDNGGFDLKAFFAREDAKDLNTMILLSKIMKKKDKSKMCMVCYNDHDEWARKFPKDPLCRELAEVNCPNKCKFHYLCIKDWRAWLKNQPDCPKCKQPISV